MIIRLVLLILMMLLSSCMGEKVAVVEKGTQADLSIADGLSVSFDDTLLSKTTEKTIVLTHSGRLDIFDLSGVEFSDESPFQFAGGTGYPGLGGDCADHIQSGESCSIVLSFTPDTERDWFDTLTINYNNGIGPTKKIIKLKGYGGNVAKLEVSATAIEMGLLEPNSTARQNFTITNSGGLTAEELDLTLLGSSYYSIVESTCSDKLARKKSCVVTVEYSPEVIATHMAEILISYVNPETEKDLSVSFTGYCVSVEAEIRILGAATYDFGSAPVGKKLTNQFTITNAGYLDAYDIHVPAQGPYALESSSCPERLKPKESCKLVINFKPTIAGDDDRLFNIQYESGKSLRNATITLEGKGVPPALIIFTQASPYNFGVKGVGDSVEITLMIGNLGGFIATNVVTTLPVDPFIVTLNTCTDSMDIGYTCMIKLKYQPTVVGVSSDQIKFEYFDGGANKQTIFQMNAEAKLIGVLTFDAANYAFGSIVVNSTTEKTITLRNIGLGTITSLAPEGILANPFFMKGGSYPGTGGTCDDSLDPFESCTMVIEASSPIAVTRVETFKMGFNNSDFLEEKAVAFSVVINTPAKFSLPVSHDFLGVSIGRRDSNGFTLTNEGQRNGRVLSITLQNGTNFTLSENDESICIGRFLATNEECEFYVAVIPDDYIVYNDVVTVEYEDGNNQILTISMNLSAEGMDLGYLVIHDCGSSYEFSKTAKDGTQSVVCTLENDGQAPLSALVIPTSTADFTFNNIDCPVALNPAETCTVEVTFTPTAYAKYDVDFIYEYNNGQEDKSVRATFIGEGVLAAQIRATSATAYDFGLVVVDTDRDKLYILYNAGGVPATNIAFSSPAAPFSVANNMCGATLDAGTTCTFYARFHPTDIAIEKTGSLTLTYDDGVTTGLSLGFSFEGIGEPPISYHRGWEEVYAVGSNVDTYNVDLGGKMVRLKWIAMTPSTASPITSYVAYRRKSTDVDYDFESPIASGISTTTRTFTDASAQSGIIYYYLVRPVIMGYPGRTLESFSEIRVVMPPNNMALGHRWMINKQICESASMTPTKTTNYSCTYAGFGAVNNVFDIGHDIIMDRYELGENYSNNPGQFPLTELSQPQAWDACLDADGINFVGISGALKKRMPSRKEFTLMGSWSGSLTDAQVKAKERASGSTNDCNGNSSEVELTGSNTGCVSKYGVMDIAGNIYEWASDRILNGEGLEEDSLRLDVNNTDLDGIDFSQIATGEVDTNNYFSLVLGMPLPTSSVPYETLAVITASKLRDNYIFAPGSSSMKIPLVGGSFNSTTYPGLYSTAWVPTSYLGGARCMITVDY